MMMKYILSICSVVVFYGCSLKTNVYQTPPVNGIVIDTESGEAAEQVKVRHGNVEATTQSDTEGYFELNATYETRYFQAMLPGSAFERVPVFADTEYEKSGIGWSRHFLNTQNEPDVSPVILFLIDNASQTDHCTSLDEELHRSYRLLKWIESGAADEMLASLHEQYERHLNLLHDSLLHQAYLIKSDCDIREDEWDDMMEGVDKLIE
jgi:hypothetical protein